MSSPRAEQARGLTDPEILSPHLRVRRAVTLLVLTLLVPGSAQYMAGNRSLGRLGLRAWMSTVALLVLGVLIGLVRRSLLLGLFTRTWFLLLLGVVFFTWALLWAVLFLDTLRLIRPRLLRPKPQAFVSGGTAVLVLLTSGTLALMGNNILAGRSAVETVFGGNVAQDTAKGRYNILLLGGDSGADRDGTRPDTIMLASVDASTGKTVMFGFARETENINFRDGSRMKELMPEGWNCGDTCLLNGLYTWAMEHRDQFPSTVKDPGALATKEAVEALSGLDIQYYALVDLKGFQRIVDAVGGLTIDVKQRTPIGGGTSRVFGYIEPGVQKLDGYHALWYARSRHGSSNTERMARQRCVLNAMVHELNPQTVLLKFKDVAAVSGSVLKTDIPESDLGSLADLALHARGQKMTSVNFVPPLINPWRYDARFVRDKVSSTIEASEADTSAPAPRRNASVSGSASVSGFASVSGSASVSASAPRTSSAATSPPASGLDPAAVDLTSVCSTP